MKRLDDNKEQLFYSIREIIVRSRDRIFRVANGALIESYWQIGKLIVEDEQMGQKRAAYGRSLLKNLADRLKVEFGVGFDETNLRKMRQFYLTFPIRDALRLELSWTHYRILMRLDSQEKREYYLNECVANGWNSRALQRQISSLAFERALPKSSVTKEIPSIHDFIKDPYIFEFLPTRASLTLQRREPPTRSIRHVCVHV